MKRSLFYWEPIRTYCDIDIEMLLSPFLILTLTGVIIIVSGSFVYTSWTKVSPLLFGWLWFNLWIAIYEMYIVYRRKQLTREKCQPGFWSQSSRP